MIELLKFAFSSFWHFLGVLILLVLFTSICQTIIDTFYLVQQHRRCRLDKRIDKLEQQIQNDRNAIADYLNEILKNKQ